MGNAIRVVNAEMLLRANEKIREDRLSGVPTDTIESMVSALARDFTADDIVAAAFRMCALAGFVESGSAGPWAHHIGDDDWVIADHALLRAAARAPLHEAHSIMEAKFAPDEFLHIVLEEADVRGRC